MAFPGPERAEPTARLELRQPQRDRGQAGRKPQHFSLEQRRLPALPSLQATEASAPARQDAASTHHSDTGGPAAPSGAVEGGEAAGRCPAQGRAQGRTAAGQHGGGRREHSEQHRAARVGRAPPRARCALGRAPWRRGGATRRWGLPAPRSVLP